MAKSSQSNQPKKGKGIILREAVSFLAGVYFLLLGDSACAVTFLWDANTDHTLVGRKHRPYDWVQHLLSPVRDAGVDRAGCVQRDQYGDGDDNRME